MANIDDELENSASAMTYDFGESVTFRAYGVPDFTVTAVVDRFDDLSASGELPGQLSGTVRVAIPTADLATGLGRDLDSGKDRIKLAMRYGEAASIRTFRVVAIDAGFTVLECR